MKVTSVLATMLAAIVLQVVMARYTVGGRWTFDLVLVGVIYVALARGPAAGIIAGTVGGLLQDLLSGGIVGVGGLAKTLVGFAAGTVGAQFIVTRMRERLLVVAAASIVHRLIFIVAYGLIDQRWPNVRWAAMLEETLLNAACAFLLLQAIEALPQAIARGRVNRRSAWRRRKW